MSVMTTLVFHIFPQNAMAFLMKILSNISIISFMLPHLLKISIHACKTQLTFSVSSLSHSCIYKKLDNIKSPLENWNHCLSFWWLFFVISLYSLHIQCCPPLLIVSVRKCSRVGVFCSVLLALKQDDLSSKLLFISISNTK